MMEETNINFFLSFFLMTRGLETEMNFNTSEYQLQLLSLTPISDKAIRMRYQPRFLQARSTQSSLQVCYREQ
jgi:hypothetical protein